MDETASEPSPTDEDEVHVALAELITGLVVDEGEIRDERLGLRVALTRVAVDFPVELQVRVGADGRVELRSAPPTQHVETSILPVWHQLRVSVEEHAEAE